MRAAGRPLSACTLDVGQRRVAGEGGLGHLLLESVDAAPALVVIGSELLTALHHLQQCVLEILPPAPQRAQLVGEFLDLLGVDRAAVEQPAIALLALPHRIDLRLLPCDQGVKV